MGVAQRFTDNFVKFHALTAQAGGAQYLAGIQGGAGVSSGLANLLVGGDGSPQASIGLLVGGGHTARFSTANVKALLDLVGVTGMLIDADAGHPGVVVYFRPYAQGGSSLSIGAVSFTFANGLLVPLTLELNETFSVISAALTATSSDGDVAPGIGATGVALPSGVYPTVGPLYALGKWVLNATTIDGLSRVSVDFGLRVETAKSDAHIYPTKVYIPKDGIRPRVTLTGSHVAQAVAAAIGDSGSYYGAAQVVGYARKRAEGGTFVANGTAQHIKFTLGKCRVHYASIDGDPKNLSVVMEPWYTPGGSPVAPLAVNTASVIN
jgi:hypothetical protein